MAFDSAPATFLRRASRLPGKWMVASGCLLLFVAGFYGCSPGSNPNYSPSSTTDQLTDGATIYTQTCATSTCHGTCGEDIRSGNSFSAWPLVGPIFQSRHPNAEIVFDVVRSGDEPNLRALTDEQIYDAIAYELSQNHIAFAAPLTPANAYTSFGAEMLGGSAEGFFPPFGDFELAATAAHASLPAGGQADTLQLRIDEFAEARSVAGVQPSAGGVFLMLVFVLTDTGQTKIQVGPEHITLTTSGGATLYPESLNVHTAIETFHDQNIEPQHGTAALAIFRLSVPEQFEQLVYSDRNGNHLAVNLKP